MTPATEPIISADDHMDLGVLPPALWVDGLPASLRERAPSVVETPHGRMWKAGDRFLGRSGQRSAGLLATEDPGFRPGVPTDRLADMDRDGVRATVIYGPFLSLMLSDPELASACERVYNEWALEFSAHDPTRLLALPFVPAHDPALAAEELVRIADAGHRGVLMYPWTDGDQPFEPSWEPFWAAADEIGFPVHFHIGGGLRTLQLRPGTWSMPAASAVVPMHIDELLVGLVFSGTLSRHPSVQVVLGEAGLGWIPYVLERMEHEYAKYRDTVDVELDATPREIFDRQVLVTFEEEHLGVELLSRIGVDNVMWASDYPHGDSTWPHSRDSIERSVARVLDEESCRKVVYGNAARLYGFA